MPLLCLHIMLLAHEVGPFGLGQPLQEAGDRRCFLCKLYLLVCVCVGVLSCLWQGSQQWVT